MREGETVERGMLPNEARGGFRKEVSRGEKEGWLWTDDDALDPPSHLDLLNESKTSPLDGEPTAALSCTYDIRPSCMRKPGGGDSMAIAVDDEGGAEIK